MTASLTPSPLMQFFTSAGEPLVGGKLYTYQAGSTTPLATYTDESGTVANTNPVIMNSRGEAAVWLDSPLYKLVLKDANDVLIWTADNVGGLATQSDFQAFINSLASSSGSSLVGFIQTGAGAVATTVQAKLRENWVSVTDYGAVGDGITDDTVAFNQWTAAIAGTGKIGYIPKPTSFYKLTSSGNCTSANGTGNGITIVGGGAGCNIKFIFSGSDINNMCGWDLTGCAYGVFSDFTLIGGTSNANCPYATVLYTGATSGGAGFGGLSVFTRVVMTCYGTYTVLNQGAEQLHWIDCEAYGYVGTSATFCYVAGGTTVFKTSNFVLTASGTVNSMTAVNWNGSKAVQSSDNARIVVFHMTANSGIESIWHDGYVVVATSSPFIVMGDDANGAANTTVQHCGMRDSIIEATSSNGNLIVCKSTTASSGDWDFRGRCSVGVALTAIQFQFTNEPYHSTINWVPNDTGAWNGNYLISTPNGSGITGGSAILVAPNNNVEGFINFSSTTFPISGIYGFGQISQGTDGVAIGSPTLQGPTTLAQYNAFAKVRAGARISSASDGLWGVQSTSSVTGSNFIICGIAGYGGLAVVTGAESTNIFIDLLLVTSANVYVIQSGTSQGSPAGRTYSVAAANLRVTMASGTYATQVTFLGMGFPI